MTISIEDIKKLREQTGAGMMNAKAALTEAGGDFEKATELLRLAGQASAAKRADREARCGLIESYVHNGKIGVMVEVNCETDFVALTEDFKAFAHDIALHITAANPEYISPEDVPANVLAKEKEFFLAELEGSGKPAEIIEKIIAGKLEKYYETICLVKQPFIKDPDVTIEKMTGALVGKLGENIVIRRFQRLELGGVA